MMVRMSPQLGLMDLLDYSTYSDGKVTYSLVIKCGNNEDSFQELCRVLSRESSKIMNAKQNFELVKETKSGSKVVYGKIYTKSNGKVKCRVSLNSIKNLIGIEKLVDESLQDLAFSSFISVI